MTTGQPTGSIVFLSQPNKNRFRALCDDSRASPAEMQRMTELLLVKSEAVPAPLETPDEEKLQTRHVGKAPKELTLQERNATIDRINGWVYWRTEHKFQRLSPRKRRDQAIVLAAVQKSAGATFQHAHPQLRRHRPTVLAAVQRHGLSLRFASSELRRDRTVVLAAVRHCGHALRHASSILYGDREIVFAAVQTCGEVLFCASAALQNDPEVVLTAVRNCGDSLRHASPAVQDNEDVVLAAVEAEGFAVRYASSRLQNDARIMAAAVNKDGTLLRYASAALQDDHTMVLAAIEQDPRAIQYASFRWRNDPAFARIVVNSNGSCFKLLSPTLRADRATLWAAIEQQQRNNPSSVVQNEDFLEELLGGDEGENTFVECPLRYASQSLREDEATVLFQAKVNPGALMYASPGQRSDLAFMTRAIEQAKEDCEEMRGLWIDGRFAVMRHRIVDLARLVKVMLPSADPGNLTPHQLAAHWLADLAVKEEHVNQGLASLPIECAHLVSGFANCSANKLAAVELATCGSLVQALALHHRQHWWNFLMAQTNTQKNE